MNFLRCFAPSMVLAQAGSAVCDDAAPEPIVKLTLTKRAAAQVQKIIKNEKRPPDTLLRVGVIGDAQTGFRHDLRFARKADKTKNDREFESQGVRIVVDLRSPIFLDGTTIDFEEKPKAGFRFDNPNAEKAKWACLLADGQTREIKSDRGCSRF